jgi:hypothetical protein
MDDERLERLLSKPPSPIADNATVLRRPGAGRVGVPPRRAVAPTRPPVRARERIAMLPGHCDSCDGKWCETPTARARRLLLGRGCPFCGAPLT